MQNILVYAPNGSGTIFLKELLQNISAATGISHHSIINDSFHDSKVVIDEYSFFQDKSGLFGPIKRLVEPPDISTYKIILHVRNPLDILTSFFFSHAYSHSRKESGFNPPDEAIRQWMYEGIDTFVTGPRLKWVKDRFSEFNQLRQDHPEITFIKYEEMVSDFPAWLAKFLEPIPIVNKEMLRQGLVAKFASSFDVQKEDIHSNKRQVKPGDHRRKLKPETIKFLKTELAEYLDIFGYTNDEVTEQAVSKNVPEIKQNSESKFSKFSVLEEEAARAKLSLENNGHLNATKIAETLDKLLLVRDTKTMQTVFQQLPPEDFSNTRIVSSFLRYLFATGDNDKAIYFAEKLKNGDNVSSDPELAYIVEEVLRPTPEESQFPKPNTIDWKFEMTDNQYILTLLLQCDSCGTLHQQKIGLSEMVQHINRCPKCLKPVLINPEFISETMNVQKTDVVKQHSQLSRPRKMVDTSESLINNSNIA